MVPVVEIRVVDHRNSEVAKQLHAVQMLAYAQEARLFDVRQFPPLQRTLRDIESGPESFQAALIGSRIVGAIGVAPTGEHGHTIVSLVVTPELQRTGIARRLLAEVIARHGNNELTVQTAANNTPAVALYASAGFKEFRRWRVPPEALELVQLRRVSTEAASN
jgi:ribosomal protein S18 acetylase RimI-like enzyme